MPPGALRRSCSTTTNTLTGSAAPRGSRVAIESGETGPAVLPAEVLDPLSAPRQQVGPRPVVDEQPLDGARQGVGVARCDQLGTVTDHLGERTGGGGHDRYAGHHGFEGREP